MSPGRWRRSVVALLVGAAAAVAATTVSAVQGHVPVVDAVLVVGLCLPGLWLGLLLVRRRPGQPAGPALVALVTGPLLAQAVAGWAGSHGSAQPWPGAQLGLALNAGVWVLNLAGFVLLCLTFPDGRLPGRLWRAAPWLFAGAALVTWAAVSLSPAVFTAGGGRLPGETPVPFPPAAWLVVYGAALAGLLATLGLAVASLAVRHRRGTALVRLQLRWLVLGAISVPVLLAAGWVAEAFGASTGLSYGGFMVALLVVVPVAVTLSILQHDLLDIDRLLAASLSWLLATLGTAAGFALLLFAGTGVGISSSPATLVAAAILATLLVVPAHRHLEAVLRRVLDREGAQRQAVLRDFADAVRDGTRQPEEVEAVLRSCLADPSLRVLLLLPSAAAHVDLEGRPAAAPTDATALTLRWAGAHVGLVLLDARTPRQLRIARELVTEVRLPLEVSRLRLELRDALAQARSSQARLVEAAAQERLKLERDLHDGAQQGLLAVGMRLRSLQRRHRDDAVTHGELEAAVATLEQTVTELRRLAHGIRPSRLDDGLPAAVHALVGDSPLPVELRIDDVDASEAVATTAYYLVAEGLANTLKYARAGCISVAITSAGPLLRVEYRDDGVGGASFGRGLTALRDRVAALGGRFDLESAHGCGTTLRAEL